MIDNESKSFSSLGRKSYKGTPTLSESMSCVLSLVQSCLYSVALVSAAQDFSGSIGWSPWSQNQPQWEIAAIGN